MSFVVCLLIVWFVFGGFSAYAVAESLFWTVRDNDTWLTKPKAFVILGLVTLLGLISFFGLVTLLLYPQKEE
jgi:hypothetical protein